LREALEARKDQPQSALRIRNSRQFRQDEAGRLRVTPTVEPAENILFHDQTNVRIERQMAMLAENAIMHQAVTELMRERFQSLLKAIHGKAV